MWGFRVLLRLGWFKAGRAPPMTVRGTDSMLMKFCVRPKGFRKWLEMGLGVWVVRLRVTSCSATLMAILDNCNLPRPRSDVYAREV